MLLTMPRLLACPGRVCIQLSEPCIHGTPAHADTGARPCAHASLLCTPSLPTWPLCCTQGDEMEREARKYAEQQAEIFREKATDLDQRLHKQMAKVRR